MIIQKLVPTYKCKWHPRCMNANFSNKSADKCSSLEAFPCIYIRPSSKRLFIQICHQDIQNHAILSKVSSINTAGLISRSCVSECGAGWGEITQLIWGAREGLKSQGFTESLLKKRNRVVRGQVEPFSHRWVMLVGKRKETWNGPFLQNASQATCLWATEITDYLQSWVMGRELEILSVPPSAQQNLRPAGYFWGGGGEEWVKVKWQLLQSPVPDWALSQFCMCLDCFQPSDLLPPFLTPFFFFPFSFWGRVRGGLGESWEQVWGWKWLWFWPEGWLWAQTILHKCVNGWWFGVAMYISLSYVVKLFQQTT